MDTITWRNGIRTVLPFLPSSQDVSTFLHLIESISPGSPKVIQCTRCAENELGTGCAVGRHQHTSSGYTGTGSQRIASEAWCGVEHIHTQITGEGETCHHLQLPNIAESRADRRQFSPPEGRSQQSHQCTRYVSCCVSIYRSFTSWMILCA